MKLEICTLLRDSPIVIYLGSMDPVTSYKTKKGKQAPSGSKIVAQALRCNGTPLTLQGIIKVKSLSQNMVP